MLNKKTGKPGSVAGILAKTTNNAASSSSQWPPLPDRTSPTLNQSSLEAASLPLASLRNQSTNAPVIPRSQSTAAAVPTTPWDRSTPVPDPWVQPTSTPWNIAAPGNTNNGTSENRYGERISKQSDTFAREQIDIWPNADGTNNAPPPSLSNPRYQQVPSHSLDDENTGVRRAIQPEQLSGPKTPIRNSNEPVDSRQNVSDGYAWPLPTAWQQAGMLDNDGEKNDSVKIPQTPQNPAPGTRLNEYRNSKQQ